MKPESFSFAIFVAMLISSCMASVADLSGCAEKASPRNSNVVCLTGNVPTADLSGFIPAPPDARFRMEDYFALRNKKELDDRIAAMSDPRSPNYGRAVSREEFNQRYRPRWSDYYAVESWLKSSGFTILRADYWFDEIAFSGTAALAEQVFGVRIVVKGSKYSNTNDPSIPAQFEGIIGAILINNVGESGPASRMTSLGAERRQKLGSKSS